MMPNQQGITTDPALSSNSKQGNRNPRWDANHGRRNHRRFTPRAPKFEGHTAELKGHIYNAVYALQANLFVIMIRELAEYAERACNDLGDICKAILEQEDVNCKLSTLEPEFQEEDMKSIAAILIQKEYNNFMKQKATYKQNKTHMYVVTCVQCAKAMQAKLESDDDFKIAADTSDVILLLQLIKKVAYQYKSHRYP
eukprot:3883227-Ditylum_brightwellii.AAC.2